MPRLDGERTLMRIFIGESDRHQNKPLYNGFGANSVLHTDGLLRLSQDLPLVIEVVDNDEKIEQIIPQLDEILQGGMITLEKARVIFYKS